MIMAERLVRAEGLTAAQLEAIAGLAEACDRAEGLKMRLNWPSLRRRSSYEINDFLYYDGQELIGFLGLYQFAPHESEASAMTHPAYRRRGIFTRLLAAAMEELRERSAPEMLFFADRKSPSVKAVAQALNASYDHSEYLMALTPDRVRLSPGLNGVELRPAERDDLEQLALLDEEAFNVPAVDNHYLQHALADAGQHLWAVIRDGVLIGKIQGRAGDGESHIYGFAIAPPLRGRGYGRAALSEAVRRLLLERKQAILLEVLINNEQALHLYEDVGFKTTTAYDYYRLRVAG
jgi:ribosomal protein S18 acetylase RimI-like enzyme